MLLIAGRHHSLFAALGLNSFDSIADAFGPDRPPKKTGVFVAPRVVGSGEAQAIPIFYKQYFHRPASAAFLGRASKARREFDNYATFAQLGVRCAEPLACGEQRDRLGRLRSAFIMTRAIPDAVGLIEFITGHGGANTAAARTRSRRAALRELADMTRTIHRASFFHHDLVWRNILVTADASGPQVWWIDCPRGQFDRWSPWRRRRQLKDLASLDKCGSQHCSRTERLDFIKAYLGKISVDAEVRTLSRDVTRYRRNRWPEDWHGR